MEKDSIKLLFICVFTLIVTLVFFVFFVSPLNSILESLKLNNYLYFFSYSHYI